MPDGVDSATAPARPAPTEIIQTMDRRVACDGGGGTLGHPRIYMTIAGGGAGADVMCPYCSRLFVLAPGAGGPGH